jgi:hypothetical protein
VGFEDEWVGTYLPDWYPVNIFLGFTQNYDGHGDITVVASTHNLAFIGNFNGYVGTNTW